MAKEVKTKVFDLDSKKLPEPKNNSESKINRDQKSAERELASIRSSNDANMGSIIKLSGSLRKTLNTSKTALPEAGVNGNTKIDIDNSNVLNIVGKFKSKEEAEAVISAQIEEATAQVSLYNHTGVYAKMLEARRSNFIEENLPVVRTSLELFVDDVNNGSFRGSEYGNHNKFRFYENGTLITDTNKIEKMTEYLNPTSYSKLSSDEKSFDEIDATGDYLAYKHGNSDTRLISHKDVAKDMYIKYVMKEAKRKTVGSNFVKERVVLPSNESSLENINNFITNVYHVNPVGLNDDLSSVLSAEILDSIPPELLRTKDRFLLKTTSNESIELDRHTYHEFITQESFIDFAERYLNGKTAKVYNINTKEDREEVIDGYCFTYETNGLSSETANAILNELVQDNFSYAGQISNESIDFGIESFINTDDKLVPALLTQVSFEDIYNTSFDRIASYNKINMSKHNKGEYNLGFESAPSDNMFLRANGANIVDRLYIRCFNTLNRNEEISLEYGIPDNTLNASYGVQELGGYQLDEKNDGQLDKTSKRATEKVKQKRINYNKLEKMFGNIRGCTVEFLDNTRKIPLIAGNKKIGDFYIEYTHQDIQHFIGLRTILGNPISYTQNMDMLNVRTDEQEETLGRLIFSDVIKPLLEQNIDTKFIRNNSDVLYALQKLMEENELSQSMSYNDLTRFSMYNLSRIIFIPASQTVFKRNGNGPLGESRFAQAIVPATSFILAREAYLSWILADAKGISFLTIPKGMSELGGEYGQDHLKDRIDDLNVSRAKLRDIAFNNTPLTHRLVLLEKGEEAEQDIDIKTIEYPDFQINEDQMTQWLNEATSIIGVSSALFMNNNNEVELMHKLSFINDKDMIRVLKCRNQKKTPSSQLATRLLQLRGGMEEYKDIQVEWIEPSINSYNYQSRGEIIDQLNATIEKYIGLYDQVFENDEEYKSYRSHVIKELIDKLADSDSLIVSMDSIVKEARQKFLVGLTEEVEEKNMDKQNEKNEEENVDQDNQFNPDNAEQDLEENDMGNDEGNPFA